MKIFGLVNFLCSIWPSQSYFSQRELNLAASTMLYIAPLEGGGALQHGGGMAAHLHTAIQVAASIRSANCTIVPMKKL